MKKKKFIVIVSHPIQYHAILWRSIEKLDEIELEVWFCSNHGQEKILDIDFGIAFKWDVPLTQGYKHRFFKNYGFGNGFFKYLNLGIISSVLFSRHNFVYFHGVNNFTAYLSFWIAKCKRSKTILRIIAHRLDQEINNGIKSKLRNLIYGSVFRKSSVCLFIGEHNKDFYKSFGVKDTRLIHAPHIVDNQFFQTNRLSDIKINTFKKKNKIDDKSLVLLFCGKLISKKQPELLLEAFLNCKFNKKVTLLFVGDGILRKSLETKSSKINKEFRNKKVIFLGFQNQTQLPFVYSISDVLVLPSFHQETWGLVINEALNFSMASIVSDKVGCGPELVQNKTGFVVNTKTSLELKNAIEQLVNDEELLLNFKRNSLNIINEWSDIQFTESIKKIINE
jgi:glycosyltransferase involved in cell wall biosynthesis